MKRSVICEKCGTYHDLIRRNSVITCCGQVIGGALPNTQFPLESPPYPHTQLLYVEGVGLGVKARHPIKKDVCVERCPAYLLTKTLNNFFRNTRTEKSRQRYKIEGLAHPPDRLFPYRSTTAQAAHFSQLFYPAWTDKKDSETGQYEEAGKLLVLGHGMLYNHGEGAAWNAYAREYDMPEVGRRFVDIIARRDIEAGEEVRINYSDMYNTAGGVRTGSPGWFKMMEPTNESS